MDVEINYNIFAVIISFLIWLDIDILLTMKISKKTIKTKNELFIENAVKAGTCVNGVLVDKKDYYYEGVKFYSLKYEYIVNGRKYYKKINIRNNQFISNNIDIYYKSNNPKKSITNNEKMLKKGFIYNFASICIPFSIFLGFPILAIILSIVIDKIF